MSGSRHPLERFKARARSRVRVRRALATAAVALAALSAAAILAALLQWTGWVEPGSWTHRAVWVVVSMTVGAGICAMLAPIRGAALARELDRRLHLEGALVTALEVESLSDPVCQLLVHRTENALRSIPLGRALPMRPPAAALVVPALVLLAIALNAQPPARRRAGAEGVRMDRAVRSLSSDLQSIASVMLSAQAPAHAESANFARRVLEIDAALRQGSLSPDQAWSELAELAASLTREPVRDGKTGPTRAWKSILESLTRGKVAAGSGGIPAAVSPAPGERSGAPDPRTISPPGVSPGADGRAAGSGTAELKSGKAPPASESRTRSSQTQVWVLPVPSRWTGPSGTGIPWQEGPLPRPPGDVAGKSSQPAVPGLPLTAGDRDLMDAYFRALRRAHRGGGLSRRARPDTSQEQPTP